MSDVSPSPGVPAAGIATHLEEEDMENEDEEEVHGLSEARAVYSGQSLPDFVIRRPGDSLKREVLFRPRKKQHDDSLVRGELSFEP